MKILLIGFEKFNERMYPHTYDTIKGLQTEHDLTYFHFKTRDILTIYRANPYKITTYLFFLMVFYKSIIDMYELFMIGRKIDRIIASDQFIFLIVSFLFPKKKIILWSLDIYPTDNKVAQKKIVRLYLSLQKKMLLRNKNVIIQDTNRLKVLADLLNIESKSVNVFFFPVSLKKISYFESPMCSESPILLQIGNISVNGLRYSKELLLHYQNNHGSYNLFIHGTISKDFKNLINNSSFRPVISESMLDSNSLSNKIKKCHIGFIGYEFANENDLNGHYISNASGQLVEFIRIKKPIISFGNTDLATTVMKHKMGIHLEKIEDLNDAIDDIMSRYDYYSENSHMLFENHYRIEKYMPSLLSWLSCP